MFAAHLERSKTNHSPKTHYEQGLNGRRILAWLEERGINGVAAITTEVVEDFKTSRRFDKVSAARINAELNTWKIATKIAVEEWGLLPERALKMFVKLREPRPQPHRVGLTKADLEAFIAAEEHPGYRALFRTVLGTGMRDDEARHLEASDIQPPWIVVTPKAGWSTKNYRYRSIPVSAATVKAARTFVKAKPDLNLEAKAVWKRIRAAAKAAKITLHFSMHDLRRAWASHMLMAGNRLEDISKWLGHGDLVTTMRYLRVVSDAAPDPKRLPF